MNIGCAIGRHVPAFRPGIEMEPGVSVGPCLRYCSRCLRILPGDLPAVGDRAPRPAAVVHVRLAEIDQGLMEGVVDLLAAIDQSSQIPDDVRSLADALEAHFEATP